jgi:hypothetical protein
MGKARPLAGLSWEGAGGTWAPYHGASAMPQSALGFILFLLLACWGARSQVPAQGWFTRWRAVCVSVNVAGFCPCRGRLEPTTWCCFIPAFLLVIFVSVPIFFFWSQQRRVYTFRAQETGRKLRIAARLPVASNERSRSPADHADKPSPHDARRVTDVDPPSGPGLNDTATSCSIQWYRCLPLAVAGIDAPAESFSAIGCVQPQHSARTISPRSCTDRGA